MIVAGFGFRAGATTASLRAALAAAGSGRDVTHLATLADKAPALAELAAQLALPLIPIAADRVASWPTISRSPASLAARGTGSVAEACALAGAGEGARLRAARSLSPDRMATCAIAQGASS